MLRNCIIPSFFCKIPESRFKKRKRKKADRQRQIEELEAGNKIIQESLRWDEISGRTFSMRDKEDAQDYRYFPEPDLVAIKLSEEYINKIKESLPELPESRKKRYISDYELTEKAANFVTASKHYSELFEEATAISGNPKTVGNMIMSDIARILNEREEEPEDLKFTGKELGELVQLIDKGTISSAIAKKVLEELFNEVKMPSKIIEEKGWVQISDESAIKEVVMKVLENNPQSINILEGLEEKIAKLQRNSIIILHTMGSHGPTYYKRYPNSFKKFTPACETADIQDCTQEQIINTYDNTIVYTDHIISSVINILKRHPEFQSSLIYVSDHGESLGENGIYLHGLPYSIAPDEQTKIPFLLWLSDTKKRFGNIDESCIKIAAAKNKFSHDNLFHSVLGLTNTQTTAYKPALDIFAACRK